MTLSNRLDTVTKIGVGAALAFWFAYYVLGSERSASAAHIMTMIWVSAVFLKLWIDKKAGNG